nr:C25 family cysteine peptidase [bacterium]
MRRTILITLTILLLGVCSAHAEWFGLETAEINPVALTVGQADENGLTIQVDLSGIEFTEPESGYVKIALPEEGFSGEIGEPALPVINRMVRVPLGAEVRLTVRGEYEEMPVSTFTGAARVMPIQPSVPKIPGAREAAVFTVDATAYNVDRPLFAEAAQVVDDGMLRGYRLVTLQLRPVNYVPAEETLLVARHLSVDVEFVGGDMAETLAVEERYVDPRSYAMVNNIALNPTGFGEKIYPHFAPSTYLIISRPEAFNMAAVQELVEWKTQRGWNVVTVGTDETGATSQQIAGYITDAYNNWAIPPSFVLLIGDTNLVTHANGTTGAATDLYYGAVSGADYMPDLGVGRLSVRNEDHLNAIVDKLLTHEKNEWNVADNSWMTHATFMASRDNFNISEGTHNAVCTNLLEPLGFTCTKIYYMHGGTTQQALEALNTGPTIHAYSGHGS